jgi:hypothetical protein
MNKAVLLVLLEMVLVAPSFAKSVDDICIEDSGIADKLLQLNSKAISILKIPEITDAERQPLMKLNNATRSAIIAAQVGACNAKTPVEAQAAWKQGMSVATKLNTEAVARVTTFLADAYRRQGAHRLQEEK